MAEKGKSVGWVALMLGLAVAYAGWAFLAAEQWQNDPTAGNGKESFWVLSITQLANFPNVMSFGFHSRLWLIGIVVGLEIGVLVAWRVMKKLEKELWSK